MPITRPPKPPAKPPRTPKAVRQGNGRKAKGAVLTAKAELQPAEPVATADAQTVPEPHRIKDALLRQRADAIHRGDAAEANRVTERLAKLGVKVKP